MEEDISKNENNIEGIVGIDSSVSEDEGDNWTFVHSDDVSCNKNVGGTNQNEDSSDNYSEQESDSGSSIVVIDSPTSLPSTQITENLPADEGKSNFIETKEQLECLDEIQDNVSFSSQQSTNTDFLKECSPYEDIEQPDSWDCDHDEPTQAVEQDITLVENLALQDSTIHLQAATIKSQEPVEELAVSFIPLDTENSQNTVDSCFGEIGLEEITESTQNQQSCVEHEHGSTSQGDSQRGEVISEVNQACDNILPEDTQAQNHSISSTGNYSISSEVHLNSSNVEAEYSSEQPKSEDDRSDDSVDDDSEDETWEMGLEALIMNQSLSSSLSSLVQEPSPAPLSPVIPESGTQRGHVSTMKPDLLEEANRIEELDLMDYSAVSNPDLPPELTVANIVRDRHYVHHPNQRLNVQLSFIVAFALAAVIGFALGNIVGLSDNFPSRCVSSEAKHESSRPYEGWTEDDWRAEVDRLKLSNAKLNQALNEMSNQESSSCLSTHFGFQVSELMTENWDLKQSIGRIRYGKPTRSIEDRDTINRLQTENQDLRTTVGKLRYRCGQPLISTQRQEAVESPPEQSFIPNHSTLEPLWKALGAMNLTNSWNRLNSHQNNRSIEDKLKSVKASAANLIQLIGVRREELVNVTRGTNGRRFDKMDATLKKSAEKTIALMERVEKQHKSFDELLSDVERRLTKMRFKLETHWTNLLLTNDSTFTHPAPTTKAVDADWFFSMGQQREKMRRSDKQSDWVFDRARNRDQERRSRKFQGKNKKQKTFQSNSWNHYSS